jgi:exonuclease-1
MDRGGFGLEVDLDEIDKVEEMSFRNFTQDMFLSLCIISGCDYLESIKGIGFKKAYRILVE